MTVEDHVAEGVRSVSLIGRRGSGKTTVGRILATRLGAAFIDTDEWIVRTAGCSIADIFAREGEDGFRKFEREIIAGLNLRKSTVISVGGGAVLDRQNVEALRRGTTVVWLTAPPDVLFLRIGSDAGTARSRPPLTALGGVEELERVLAERESIYENAADHTLSTVERSSQEVAEQVLAELGLGG